MIYNVKIGYTYRRDGQVLEDRGFFLFPELDNDQAAKVAVKHAHAWMDAIKSGFTDFIGLAYVKIFIPQINGPDEKGFIYSPLYAKEFFFWQLDKTLKPGPGGLSYEPIDEFLERWLQTPEYKRWEVNCH